MVHISLRLLLDRIIKMDRFEEDPPERGMMYLVEPEGPHYFSSIHHTGV